MLSFLSQRQFQPSPNGNKGPIFHVLTPSDADLDAMEIMKSRLRKSEYSPVLFRVTKEQYEYLSRSAFASGHNSMQRVFEERQFKKMNEELPALRSMQKKLGVPDSKFLPFKDRKKMGLKVRRGRQRIALKEWR